MRVSERQEEQAYAELAENIGVLVQQHNAGDYQAFFTNFCDSSQERFWCQTLVDHVHRLLSPAQQQPTVSAVDDLISQTPANRYVAGIVCLLRACACMHVHMCMYVLT